MTVERQEMQVDIACVGFGPATAGFLQKLTKELVDENGMPRLQSKVMPGMPLQVLCYERADDIGFGVSGVVTKARALKDSMPEINASDIPLAAEVKEEKLVYLFDHLNTSLRSRSQRVIEAMLKPLKFLPLFKENAMEIPFIPSFMNKHGGMVFSIGQFSQWIGSQLMASGLIQIWPGTPVDQPLLEREQVLGIRLMDQGTDKDGNPEASYMPGMEIKSRLTVVGDGPVGSVGQILDEKLGLPEGNEQKDWAVGAKMLIQLPDSCTLEPGTVIHTVGFPEPEIFGFFYVLPDGLASAGIFIPSWMDTPIKNSYRYLQHWLLHPYIWQHVQGGTMRSWGAKSIQESGRRGEPFLAGDGWARIGEGSGTTNVLANSGVDEAWFSGVLLAEAVIELENKDLEFTKENLQNTYIQKRRNSWLEKEAKQAEKARDGFQKGFIPGMTGMVLTWLSGGKLSFPAKPRSAQERAKPFKKVYGNKLSEQEIEEIRKKGNATSNVIYNQVMNKVGWPEIPYDGQLLVSHQDALLMGGKVQAPHGYRDHVRFLFPHLCKECEQKTCIEICSGQAITPNDEGVPVFEREKCIHCGACMWSCVKYRKDDSELTNIDFKAGTGGLHSAEN
ncbi:4Fe-4S ferredoxin [candidate division KSB1 bacterium]|nr:4Fe-4S ferredoxin [candidate division KSB1 bacterium]